jgi:hypothetical protein
MLLFEKQTQTGKSHTSVNDSSKQKYEISYFTI